MACPKCGCKVTYSYDPEWDGMGPSDERLERCAACRHVFDVEDSADEDDEPATAGAPEPVGINGLTEAETSATASVMGIVGEREERQPALPRDLDRTVPRSEGVSAGMAASDAPVRWCPECRSAGVVGIEQDVCPTCDGTGRVAHGVKGLDDAQQ